MSDVIFDESLLRERVRHPGLHGVGSRHRNGKPEYVCFDCGHCWEPRDRYFWWPVRVRWSWPTSRGWLSSYGVEYGADRIEQRVYKRVVRIGPLLIVFGPRGSGCQ